MARSLGRLIQLPKIKMVVSTLNETSLIMQKLPVKRFVTVCKPFKAGKSFRDVYAHSKS